MPFSKTIAAYGAWKSQITSDLIVRGAISFGELHVDGSDIYWSEGRPGEGGRSAVMRRLMDGTVIECVPSPSNVRTRVHEYGGGAFTVHEGTIYFSNFTDQRLYQVTFSGNKPQEPRAITAEGAFRYADMVIDARRGRILCVREDHTKESEEAVNTIVAIDISTGETSVLASGNDFYAFPRICPDGSKLAFTTWNHPNMPWDGTELWTASFSEDGRLENVIKVAGGSVESVFQPEWSPNGTLFYVSDISNWWNLYKVNEDGTASPIVLKDAEFGKAQWVFGLSTYSFVDENRILAAYTQHGTWRLTEIDVRTGHLNDFKLPFTVVDSVHCVGEKVVFFGGSPTKPQTIILYTPKSDETTILRTSFQSPIDPSCFSKPVPIEFPTTGHLTAYGFYYSPTNPDFTAPDGERPPLLVVTHGGPTSATGSTLKLGIQYWTSRGFAVLDVNYGGSTGYGREYRDRLRGQWGIVDLDDCCNGALYLAEKGLADRERLSIMGGSAGGYTTLGVLTFRNVFHAGASHFGVSDIELLALETHKFESRYTDSLVGPYPEAKEVYHARSPLYHTDKLSSPVIFFQGTDDKIVPPNQAELLVEALKKKGVPVAYELFEGEGHGFRKAENIQRSLDGQLYFFAQIFKFEPADKIEPVEIFNLN